MKLDQHDIKLVQIVLMHHPELSFDNMRKTPLGFNLNMGSITVCARAFNGVYEIAWLNERGKIHRVDGRAKFTYSFFNMKCILSQYFFRGQHYSNKHNWARAIERTKIREFNKRVKRN